MVRRVAAWALAYVFYLFLAAGSGKEVLFWSHEELIIGAIVAAVAAALAVNYLNRSRNLRMLNPKRWIMILAYSFVFFYYMAKANIDVAYRVITGRIRPGIVKGPCGFLTRDLAKTWLATSITLTPGTLTVHVDDAGNFYIHWINVRKERPEDVREVVGSLADWARRIAE